MKKLPTKDYVMNDSYVIKQSSGMHLLKHLVMLTFSNLLFVLINIDQDEALNWFGIESQKNSYLNSQSVKMDTSQLATMEIDSNTTSLDETFKLVIENLWQRVQDGLTLTDIENILFFILFLRFMILAVRYNLKTSFYITCIGLCAGYLWYRHIIDIILMYRQMLIKVPYFQRLGTSAIELESTSQALTAADLKISSDIQWYNPGKLLYFAITKGIIHTDSESGVRYYIDPISMIISNLSEANKMKVLPMYYKIYNIIIPRLFETISEFWNQLSGIAAYCVITRIGKRYCPYLIRWHWTFLLIIGFAEQILIYFIYRLTYFQDIILHEKIIRNQVTNSIDMNLVLQLNLASFLLVFFITLHLGSLFLGLFHAIWGQYFYFPFLVENTELHIGPRPKNSIYSGGQTSWQDEKQVNLERRFRKLWYGWFGSGTNENWIFSPFKEFIINAIKKLIRPFRK